MEARVEERNGANPRGPRKRRYRMAALLSNNAVDSQQPQQYQHQRPRPPSTALKGAPHAQRAASADDQSNNRFLDRHHAGASGGSGVGVSNHDKRKRNDSAHIHTHLHPHAPLGGSARSREEESPRSHRRNHVYFDETAVDMIRSSNGCSNRKRNEVLDMLSATEQEMRRYLAASNVAPGRQRREGSVLISLASAGGKDYNVNAVQDARRWSLADGNSSAHVKILSGHPANAYVRPRLTLNNVGTSGAASDDTCSSSA